METPTKSFVHPISLFIETPRKGLETPATKPLTETPRRALVNQTERAIKQYLKDDCETNLPLIQKLEDISYQLWVESNTAFLDESMHSEDEEWQWDEECFHDSFPTTNFRTSDEDSNSAFSVGDTILQTDEDFKDTESVSSIESSGSSFGSSICVCDDSDCYLGYLGCSELDDSDLVTEGSSEFVSDSLLEDWIVLDNHTCSIQTVERIDENDWIILSPTRSSEPIRIEKKNVTGCRKSLMMPESFQSFPKSEESQDSEDSDECGIDLSEDWVILSFQVTEVCERSLTRRVIQPPASETKVTDMSVARTFKHTEASASCCCIQNKMCFGKVLTYFTLYLVQYLTSETKQNQESSCECCRTESVQNVLTLIGRLLMEIYRKSY